MAQPIFINFTDHNGDVIKTYTTVSVKTGMMDRVYDFADRAIEIKSKNDVSMKEVKEINQEMKAIVVAVFGNQFSYDELNENVDHEELEAAFQRIVTRTRGTLRKN